MSPADVSPYVHYALAVAFFAAVPFVLALLSRPLRVMAFYLYIALVLVVGGLVGSVYVVPVLGGIPSGSIAYAALIYTNLLLVVLERSPRVVRTAIRMILGVEVFKFGVFALASYALHSPHITNPHDTDPALFEQSLRTTIAGGALIVAELLILAAVLELFKRRLRDPRWVAITCVVLLIGVLVLDGLLFPVVALSPVDGLPGIIADGVRAKLVLGCSFGVALLAFLVVYRASLAAYRERPVPLRELVVGPREELERELERQRSATRASAERYRQLVESTGDVVVSCTVDGIITSWNHAAERLYGHSEDAAVGRPIEFVTPADQLGDINELLRAGARGTTVTDHETVQRRADGSRIEVSLTLSPVIDPAGSVVGLSYIGRDIGERRRMARTLAYQARHDALTGLPNRVYADDRIAEFARSAPSERRTMAVLLVDIDQFKMVNDAAGHHIGDGLLIEAASRLRAGLRPDETVARFGGDEFVLLCPDRDEPSARALAARLLDLLAAPFDVGGHRFFVTASVGIAVDTPSLASELIRKADTAMYGAKGRGSASFQVFTPDMDERARRMVALSNDLGSAIEHDELDLHYQPIVDLRTGQVRSVEALSRWFHETRGDVDPEQFVRVAEDSGLITQLDRWVIRHACIGGARLFATGALPPDGHVAVNLSVQDVTDPDFEDFVLDAVAAAGPDFDTSRLMIELTETVLTTDVERTAERLRRLTEHGVRIAIDDFGTGYSSLTYLRPFPTTTLKIDQSFVSGIASNESDLAIVRSVVQLAHAIGLETVAEGVEDSSQLALLREMECDGAQGFLWGPAIALEGIVQDLGARPRMPGWRPPSRPQFDERAH